MADPAAGRIRRLTTETKQFFKTSEWWTYLIVLIAILIAGNSIEGEEGGADVFPADEVWLFVTILTVGYLISRGLSKSGSRDPYWDSPSGEKSPLGERVQAATEAFRGESGRER
jgi:hypothetical protein